MRKVYHCRHPIYSNHFTKSCKWNCNSNFHVTSIKAHGGERETVCGIYCIVWIAIEFPFNSLMTTLFHLDKRSCIHVLCLCGESFRMVKFDVYFRFFSIFFILHIKSKNQMCILFKRNGPAYWMAAFVCTSIRLVCAFFLLWRKIKKKNGKNGSPFENSVVQMRMRMKRKEKRNEKMGKEKNRTKFFLCNKIFSIQLFFIKANISGMWNSKSTAKCGACVGDTYTRMWKWMKMCVRVCSPRYIMQKINIKKQADDSSSLHFYNFERT